MLKVTKNIEKIYITTALGIVAVFANSTVNYMSNEYGFYFLFVLSSIGFSIFFIHISIRIKENRWLEIVGKNTMSILIFHKLPIVFFQSKAGYVSELMKNSNILYELLICIVVSFISIVFCLLASFFIQRLFPLAIGER